MAESNVEEIRSLMDKLNPLIYPYQLAYVHVSECELLQRNAHYMDKEVFDRLVENVKEDGFLSQLPFAIKQPEKPKPYLIISGNHRTKAAIKGGVEWILILYTENISEDKKLAYQLSHNALVGKDDIAILKELFGQIKSIEGKKFTGLNDLVFPDFKIERLPTINEKDIQLQEVKFLFTNARADQVHDLLDKMEEMQIDKEHTRIVNLDFDEFVQFFTQFKKFSGIKSNTVAFGKLIQLAEHAMAEKEKV